LEVSNYVIIPLFFLAAVACGITAVLSYRQGRDHGSRDPKMWLMFATIFVVFVVLKAQRVVEAIEMAARNEAQAGGVYQGRHPYQVLAVVGATALGMIQAAYFSKYIAQRWRRYSWPLMGTGTIICFGVVRAVSLHELDSLGGWLMVAKAVVESLAAGVTIWGAVLRMQHLRSPSHGAAPKGARV